MRLLRVEWKDGDIVTERHFRGLERWVESSAAVLATQSSGHGLLRVVDSDGTFNNTACISAKHLQSNQYQITLEQFQGITPRGRIVSLYGEHRFEVGLRTTDRDADGYYPLFLIPDEEAPRDDGQDVASGPVLFETPCRMVTSDRSHEGLCIARLKADGASVSLDQRFIPACFTIDASPQSLARFQKIQQQYVRLTESIEQYIRALVNRRGLEPVWAFSVELFRLLSRMRSLIIDSAQPAASLFRALQHFCDAVACEAALLEAEFRDPRLAGELHALRERLSRPLLPHATDMNLAGGYDLAEDDLEGLANLLSLFPEGPATEASLAVKEIVFSKGTAYNKVLVQFVNEVAYSREGSKLVFKLRDFAPREPSAWDVRLSLGKDMPYGSIAQLPHLLRRTSPDEFDFQIECPGSVIGSGTMKQLTLYLPPPLGENVDNHRNRVTVSLVS